VTRWVAVAVIPFLLLGFLILWGVPERTGELFAWTIQPRMTPIVMGAGYLAGAWFFARSLRAERWHELSRMFAAISGFTTLMLVDTLLHWDRFNHGHPAFWTWLALYLVVPPVVTWVWWRNRGLNTPSTVPGNQVTPAWRWATASVGTAALGLGLVLTATPTLTIPLWPWSLSPLTARVLGGWAALAGLALVGIARDPRWSAWRLPMQSATIWSGLVLAGAARVWTDFKPDGYGRFLFIAAVGAFFLYSLVAQATRAGASGADAPNGYASAVPGE
jgi:hypothetical protein